MSAPADAELRTLAEAVARHLLATRRTLVTAESCTGGWIAKACTDLPGSSGWFAGGVVAYADVAKSRLLGVDDALVATHGAVSEAVVCAMACGALERVGGDLGVAVSGVAGPGGGHPDKPVGTVWLAWAARTPAGVRELGARCELLPGDRESVRRWTVERALAGILAR